MKIRNKQTGEMCELKVAVNGDLAITKDDEITDIYSSLAELNTEWEDAPDEERKEYWCIDWTGGVNKIIPLDSSHDKYEQSKKEIGNYFETKEEAEKAVERLKAWKRLKDKGISLHLQKQFRGDGMGYSRTIYTDFTKYSQEIVKDLDLLFGGEE